MSVVILTGFTLIAFAANSVLCRIALGGELIDPASFTTIRLVGGALILIPIARFTKEPGGAENANGSWWSGFSLFAYAGAFSMAYLWLSAGMGALILFGTVQVTMMGSAFRTGERMRAVQWAGFAAAIGGLVYLVLPGISAPSPVGALLMGISGVAWGLYSIAGRGVAAPVRMTAGNFLRAAPMALIVSALAFSHVSLEVSGILLALASGAITSGLGYVLWYKTLPMLSTIQASTVQLLVPILAALGGVALLSEQITIRLTIASGLILGGVALSVLKTRRRA